jgi:hypothetical protein
LTYWSIGQKGGEKIMADVITVPRDSALQLRLVTGTNPVSGAPIVQSKTFNSIKSSALDQDAYDVATALMGLQKYPVDEIRLQKESQLTE